jgi:hypothetical protein
VDEGEGMSAQFDMRRIVDLIAAERTRAEHAEREAAALEADDERGGGVPSLQAKIAEYRAAAYWHRRTVGMLERAVPAARNWRQ